MSRFENSSAQNMTPGRLVKIARALGHEVEFTFPAKR